MHTIFQRSIILLLAIAMPIAQAIVPTPAADQSEPIAIIGAVIHTGDGQVIGDGVITFDQGVITAVGSASDNIDTSGHQVIDV
ncbi:unnamed protein product, partial [Discosporangium mesarthrocarpum]